jgi:MFS family permease
MRFSPPKTRTDYDPYAPLRIRDFRLLLSAGFLNSIALAMFTVVIGWEQYDRTDSALALGIVGLVQIVPNIGLSLPAGAYVDNHDRRKVAMVSAIVIAIVAAALTVLTATEAPVPTIYVALFIMSIARAFNRPTSGALLASTVPGELLANSSAWRSSSMQIAQIVGPATGGFGVSLFGQAAPVFAISAVLLIWSAIQFAQMKPAEFTPSREKMTKDALLAGVRFIHGSKVILAAITLDMVAVLLGGATALLPIFAEDVLHVGSTGLGLLRTAPAVGGLLTSLFIARRGPFSQNGRTLLIAVAGFGIATILFGISRNFWLSMLALALVGSFDTVSVVIRNTLQLALTPDAMRGRVSSVHFMFVGMSNEFGEFESGVAAALLGATTAVALGGIGTLLVVPVIALVWPQIRHLREIHNLEEG